eukprot:g1879.t1
MVFRRGYHEVVHDHFNNPRNVGSLDKEDAAEVFGTSCGDVIKLQVKVSKDGVIEDAKFKTFGCGSAIASSSYATEMIIGQKVEEVRDVFSAARTTVQDCKFHRLSAMSSQQVGQYMAACGFADYEHLFQD